MTGGSDARPMARQCTGTVARTGKRCRLPPIIGGTVCWKHGGSAPQVRAAANRRVTEAEALAALAAMNLPPMADPLAALSRMAAEAVAWCEMLRGQVAQLDSLTGADHQGDERARVRVVLLERAMDRAQRFAADLAKLNLDERIAAAQARAAVLQGELMAGLVRAILARLGDAGVLAPDPRTGVIVAEEFRALEQRAGGHPGQDG